MRGLRLFGLLCAGVVVLLVCWLAALATLAGFTLQPSGALWALLGIPLVAVLLLSGFGLALPFVEELEPGDGGLTGKALVGFFFVAFGALVVAGSVTSFSGAQIYHSHFGERTEAVVTRIAKINNETGGVTGWRYHVDDTASGQDLGELAVHPGAETVEGDRIAVSVDRSGWMRPVPVDRMGWTTVPSTVLICCAGVVAFAALGVVVTAFGVQVARRPR
jgi:hypothetical protein